MLRSVFKKYPRKLVYSELNKTMNFYYTPWSQLAHRLEISFTLSMIFLVNILCSCFMIYHFSKQIEAYLVVNSSSSVSGTLKNAQHAWHNINWVKAAFNNYGDFVSNQDVLQPLLFKFSIYALFSKILVASSVGLYLTYIYKFFIAAGIFSYKSPDRKDISTIGLDVAINPFPFYALNKTKKLNFPTKQKKIKFTELFNSFLEVQKFPEINSTEDETLLSVEELSFMYHGDFSWDRYFHLFLKKYFPSLYTKHLISKNTKSKQDEAERSTAEVLKNINLHINKSSFTTILGCNGSSKTTFLKAIINLFESYSGKIAWISKDLRSISTKSFYKHVAYVAQENFIHNDISVYDYVACGLFPSFSLFKFTYSKEDPFILENLKKMGILEHKDKNLNKLSGGEKQKAILARVLTQKTEVIVLDEPTTYLDIANQYLILDILKKLQKEENKTIITILHDIKQAEQFSDHVIILDKGKVYKYGKTSEVITKDNIEAVFEIPYY